MGLGIINEFKRTHTPYMTKYHPIIEKDNKNDKVYTPERVAKDIIKTLDTKFGINGKVLEPCKGGGAFYNNIPDKCEKLWCEIDEGVDFFNFNDKVDWIITNPPYSIFDEFILHSFEIANNIALLIPINKLTSSHRRIMDIKKYGGVVYIKIYKGSECNFPFGFACGLVYLKKGYKGGINIDA